MMKALILSVMLAATLLAGCKKEKALPSSITGQWELRHILGVQVYNAPSVFKAGNGRIVEFTASTFQYTDNGKVTHQGTYRIVKDSAFIDGTRYTDAVIFNNEQLKRYFKISGRNLMISIGSQASDGFTETYESL